MITNFFLSSLSMHFDIDGKTSPNLLILDQNWNALVEISRESPQALQALKEVSESSSMP